MHVVNSKYNWVCTTSVYKLGCTAYMVPNAERGVLRLYSSLSANRTALHCNPNGTMAAAKAAHLPLRAQLGSAFCARLAERKAPSLKGTSCNIVSCRSFKSAALSLTIRGWQLSYAVHNAPTPSELCTEDSRLRTCRQNFSSKNLTGERQHLKQGDRTLPLARSMAAGVDTPQDGEDSAMWSRASSEIRFIGAAWTEVQLDHATITKVKYSV